MKKDINTILLNLKNEKIIKSSFLSQDQQKFWANLSQAEITQISNSILSKDNNNLHKLDKYSLTELNFIYRVFSIQAINKKIKSFMDKLDVFFIYNILDYRIYYTNLELIKRMKNYKKIRIKQEKENKNGK